MVKEIVQSLIVEKVLEMISWLKDRVFVPEPPKQASYEKYMINSCRRKIFNNATLSNVDITYTFKDNSEDKDMVALDIQYIMEGNAPDKLNYLLFYLNMKENSNENFSAEAYDCIENNEYRVTMYKENNTDSLNGHNGNYWKIPFYNREVVHMDKIKTKIILSWKRFYPVSDVMTLIIDPRNYSTNTKNVNITVKNEARNFDIEYINIEEYNRNTRKLDGSGVRQIYNIGNRIDDTLLVDKDNVLKNGMNENSVFLMKVKC